uniref:Uncharacterized protein n=1 Tax=Romanomermis culicivorax TaxID=13658 RepID=A0A915HRW8_ROMCU
MLMAKKTIKLEKKVRTKKSKIVGNSRKKSHLIQVTDQTEPNGADGSELLALTVHPAAVTGFQFGSSLLTGRHQITLSKYI